MAWLQLQRGMNLQRDWVPVTVKAVQTQEMVYTMWSIQQWVWPFRTKIPQRSSWILKFSSGGERHQKSYDMGQNHLCYLHQVCRKTAALLFFINFITPSTLKKRPKSNFSLQYWYIVRRMRWWTEREYQAGEIIGFTMVLQILRPKIARYAGLRIDIWTIQVKWFTQCWD